MKKLLTLTAILFVSACAYGPIYGDEDCEYTRRPRKNYRVQKPQPAPVVKVAQPQTIPCYQAQPVIVKQPEPCNGCQPTVKAVREPVEIVYKKVIYTTTYEPKTTQSVVYEREPISNATVQEIKVHQPVVQEIEIPKPVVKEVIIQEPTVSRVIETQVNQEPIKISVEEVK